MVWWFDANANAQLVQGLLGWHLRFVRDVFSSNNCGFQHLQKESFDSCHRTYTLLTQSTLVKQLSKSRNQTNYRIDLWWCSADQRMSA